MNKNKVENYSEKIPISHLKIVNEKAFDWQNCVICIQTVYNTIVKNINCDQCSHMLHDVCFRQSTLTSINSGK